MGSAYDDHVSRSLREGAPLLPALRTQILGYSENDCIPRRSAAGVCPDKEEKQGDSEILG
jgi:hypothetical protein